MDEHVLPNEKSFVDDHLDYEHYEKCFIGSYSHSLDGKGRLVVPQSFREELGKTFYIAPSKDFSYAPEKKKDNIFMFSLYFILFTFVLQIQKSLKKFNNHLPFIVIFQYKKEVSSNHSVYMSMMCNKLL